MTVASTAAGDQQAPALLRRMACFLYEAVVLFGIGLIAGAIGALLVAATGPQHAEGLSLALQLVGFVVYGGYFTWFWSKGGQTLPMQTWHIRVLTVQGRALSRQRALLRYLACYVWIAPAAVLAHLGGWSRWQALGAVAAWVAAYALLALLNPTRQFWHDRLCGTQLVHWQNRPKP